MDLIGLIEQFALVVTLIFFLLALSVMNLFIILLFCNVFKNLVLNTLVTMTMVSDVENSKRT